MRYLSSISLALIVMMALACKAEPAPTPTPTPPGPMLTESEAIAVVKTHLSLKPWHTKGTAASCLMYLYDSVWQAEYAGDGVWEVRATEGSDTEGHEDKRLVWDVYEQTASVVATGKYQKRPHFGWLPNECFDLHIRNEERR